MSVLDRMLGRPLASAEEEEQKVGALAGVPMLGLDALSSAAYGPEAALTVLLPLGVLGLAYIGPITIVILALLTILYFSYRQTIVAYPTGGGSYTVAKENLGTRAGLLAAASLLLDYILNVAVGIAAGVGALVSAVPVLHPHILALCLLTLAIIALVNLRGVRESGAAFILPTYLFVGTLGLTLLVGLARTLLSHGQPQPVEAPPAVPAATAGVTLWLLMRSFSSGCTAMTGVEAISNG
ncbi:MAG: APC family permease, partial [Armatimonadetes bacterium]|nr:APC family permease [Armatimonadota bacterium]